MTDLLKLLATSKWNHCSSIAGWVYRSRGVAIEAAAPYLPELKSIFPEAAPLFWMRCRQGRPSASCP